MLGLEGESLIAKLQIKILIDVYTFLDHHNPRLDIKTVSYNMRLVDVYLQFFVLIGSG